MRPEPDEGKDGTQRVREPSEQSLDAKRKKRGGSLRKLRRIRSEIEAASGCNEL